MVKRGIHDAGDAVMEFLVWSWDNVAGSGGKYRQLSIEYSIGLHADLRQMGGALLGDLRWRNSDHDSGWLWFYLCVIFLSVCEPAELSDA